jgi:hypothetical protein
MTHLSTHFSARLALLLPACYLLTCFATAPARAQRHESSFSLGTLRPEGIARRVDGRSYTVLSYQNMTAQSRILSTGFFADFGSNNPFGGDTRYRYSGTSRYNPYQVIYGGGFQGRVIVPSSSGNTTYASVGIGHYNLAEYERIATNYYDSFGNSDPFYDIPRGSLYLGMTAKMSLGIELKRRLFLEATYHRPVKAISNQRGLTGFGVSLGARL